MGKKSIEELKEMPPDARDDYLMELDTYTEEEWEIYKESSSEEYSLREITRRTFETDEGDEYLISVEHWWDGERPDEMNTQINIVRLD